MVLKWYSNAMKTTIDRAGRVVIPKAIRDRAGLKPGTELEIAEDNGEIKLVQSTPQGRVIERDGYLLWEAAESAPVKATRQAILDAREERHRELLRRTGLEDRAGH